MSLEQELNGEDIQTTSENDPKPKKQTKHISTKKNEKATVDEVSPESCKAKVFYGTHKTNMLALLNRDRTDEDSYCDITVHVDGQPFPAHKCILGKLSVFFHKMFKVEMQERYSTDAQIYGVSKLVFQTIFNYMYTGTIKLTEDNVMNILMAADYLQMDALKKFCVEFLGAAMNITNCLEIQRTGQFFNCPSLSDAAETMTARKFREIIEQQQFKDLDKQSLIQFISSRDQKAFGSKDVYEGVLSWVNYDLENRKEDFVELFKLIKLHLMQPDYLEEIVDQQELVQQSHECKDYFKIELLYCLKLSKFMHHSPKATPAGDSKFVVESSMERSTDTNKTEPEQLQTKVVLKPTPAQNPIPAKPKNNITKKKRDNIPKTPSTSDIPIIQPNSNSIPEDSPGPSNAHVNSPSNAGSDRNYSGELVRILQHSKDADISLNDDEFANVNDISSQKFGRKTLKDLRKSGDIKGFEMKQVDSVCRIRATDKHSVEQTSRVSQGGQGRLGYGYSQQMQPQKIIKKISIQREPEPELNRAENPWKPSRLENKKSTLASTEQTGKLSKEEQTATILKKVMSTLNKLTVQKFTPLMQKFRYLPINTENRLREVINLIFEKAINEPIYCEVYANMCCTLSQWHVTALGSAGGNQGPAAQPVVKFRKVLLTRCQKEFENRAEKKCCELRKKIEEAPAEVKKTLKQKLEIVEAKERRRIMGNIRFIGELFRLGMLTENIMNNCIMTLFRARDENSLESLCILLTIIGKTLDHAKGKERMDRYFTQIDRIIKEKRIPPRVKFMLKDVEDLRKSNWVQRAIKAQGPKTIDQIHQDAKEEKEQMALKTAAAPPVKSQGLLAFYDDATVLEANGNVTSSSPRKNFINLVADISEQLDNHSNIDPIFDWVEATTNPQERSLPFFVRALTTAVCNSAIVQRGSILLDNEKFEVDKELVTSRSILLRKFLDNDDKELQAVYALQKLYVVLDQPPNVLKLFFDFLYDEDVISEETFFKWENSDDPAECDGKGMAVTSVNSFLTWLRQSEVESDE